MYKIKRKIAVVGSRNVGGTIAADEIRRFILSHGYFPDIVIISGGALGVDTEAKNVAKEMNLDFEEFVAHWDTYGKRAGIVRNDHMAQCCDEVFAVWDGASPGTHHMIKRSADLGKRVTVSVVS
jgi:uncharacterized phage-like protein YoqJ